MPQSRFGGRMRATLLGVLALTGVFTGLMWLSWAFPELGVLPERASNGWRGLGASSPITTPTGVASPPITATGTVTITPETSPTSTVTATRGVSETVTSTATEAITPTITPTITLSPTPTATSSPIAAYTPYLAREHSFAGGARRAWGAQFAADDVPEIFGAVRGGELVRLRTAGVNMIRTHVYWDAIAPTARGVEEYDWAATDERLRAYSTEGGGFDLVLSVVSYPDWAMTYRCGGGFQPGGETALRDFVQAAATRYGRAPYRAVAWEIGNEVDGETSVEASDWERAEEWGHGEPTVPHGGCWGDRPEEYVRFLRIAAEGVRAADRGALVTLGNLALVEHDDFHADFMERFLAAGGGGLIDYFGYHWFPDLRELIPDGGFPSGEEKADLAADTLARNGARMPLWLTETYRLTRMGDSASEVAQIRFVTRELPRLIAHSDIRHIFWYGWLDFAGVPAGTFQRGIVRADHTPKPALQALPSIIRATDGSPHNISDGRVEAYRFTGRDGRWIVAWSRDGSSVPFTVEAGPGLAAVGWLIDEGALTAGTPLPEVIVPSSGGAVTLRVGRDTVVLRLQPAGDPAPERLGD